MSNGKPKSGRAVCADATADPFVAIDFETADRGYDSACAVALVRVEGRRIVQRQASLIRPPRSFFEFTYVHGISWKHVASQPTFAEVWPELSPTLDGVQFLAAHNAAFDQAVLQACCHAAGLQPPCLPFVCTMRLARRHWGIYPTKLPDVCAFLKIALKHHDPCSDAEACARIVMEMRKRVLVSTSTRSGSFSAPSSVAAPPRSGS